MSDINIKSEKDLVKFLKIISQESYKKSINESYLDYSEKYSSDEKRYGNLSASSKKKLDEEEDEGENILDRPDEEQSGELQNKDKSDSEEKPIADKEEAMTTVSFDSVIDRINTLRAGRSTKDKQIKRSLEDYYNKLDENERIVLKIFLEELSDILGGEISGVDAKDPSDPPDNFKITSGEEEADKAAAADVPDISQISDEEGLFGDQEDTTPPKEDEDLPVAVNERKSDWELRMKIRELMER